jgi:hypothetical protein
MLASVCGAGELATQIERDVLPAARDAGVKVYAVGVGSAESAATFAERSGFPAELLLADSSDDTEAYAAVGTRNTGRDAQVRDEPTQERPQRLWRLEPSATHTAHVHARCLWSGRASRSLRESARCGLDARTLPSSAAAATTSTASSNCTLSQHHNMP